jgi:hypothetical protein
MLCRIAEVLLEREVLDGLEFQKLVDGEELPPKEDNKPEAAAVIEEPVVEEPELNQQKSYDEIVSEITDDKVQDDKTQDEESNKGVF